MRLSLLFLVTTTLALLASSTAEFADTASHQLLRRLRGPDKLRDLTTEKVNEINDSEDLAEERGGNAISSAALKWRKIRTSERLKELKEALSIGKDNVRVAAQAAAEAAVKAKHVDAISKIMDDMTELNKMAKNPAYKSKVYGTWHNLGIDAQTVYTTIKESGKFTLLKWDNIAAGYLDYVTGIALAATKRSS
ncbi:unnamed protein product [Phytophthora fragariaefolia]|uniref:Unnamed protein product n=1 Tax=Phytophthora fragariaefolia TaxID=1490495 RepID=A0A9W6Y3N5_9STRA|nr:unnamed protein product [Phytophthora fragariaefolia]